MNAVRLAPAEASLIAELNTQYREKYLTALANVRVALHIATPSWASAVLNGSNNRNRKLSQAWRKIVRAIQELLWEVNGEAIVFDLDGNLINGQHRLHSIAQCGTAVPVIVFYGVAREAFATFDQNKRRSASDVLSIDERFKSHPETLASAISWLDKARRDELGSTTKQVVPNETAIALADSYPGLVNSVEMAHGEYRNRLLPPGMVAFLHYTLSAIDEQLATDFLSRVAAGFNVVKDSWEDRLRGRLNDFVGERTSVQHREMLALCIKAFNGIATGAKPPKILIWKSGGDRPEPFPKLIQEATLLAAAK